MIKKNINIMILGLFFITILFCSIFVSGEEKEIKLNKAEWKKLNTFFSNFSEAFVNPFEKDQISNKALIEFGVLHNFWNNYKLFESSDSSYLKLNKKYVEASVEKYLGGKIVQHETVNDITYKDGYYIIPDGNGEVYIFSQVTKFIDNGNGFYTAYLNIYAAGSGFTGDPNADLKSWKKEGDVPNLSKKMKATIQKISSNGSTRYILIDYLDVK